MIGTAIKHMESIMKYSQNNNEFKDAFMMLYISLQNYVYIELFKIFDSNGKKSKENSIYTLINMIETEDNKRYHNKISQYKSDIDFMKKCRNHYFAHDTGEDVSMLLKQNGILRVQELLEIVVEICCDANDKLYPNTYVSNVRCFDNWCYMAITSINEDRALNDKLTNASVEKELYEENLDWFISYLKVV